MVRLEQCTCCEKSMTDRLPDLLQGGSGSDARG